MAPNGLIIAKENTYSRAFLVHKDDYSVTRSEKLLKLAFEQAGLRVLTTIAQKDFPKELLKVKMFVCAPI